MPCIYKYIYVGIYIYMHAWYLYQVNEQLRKQAERQLAIDNRHSTIANRTNCPM